MLLLMGVPRRAQMEHFQDNFIKSQDFESSLFHPGFIHSLICLFVHVLINLLKYIKTVISTNIITFKNYYMILQKSFLIWWS